MATGDEPAQLELPLDEQADAQLPRRIRPMVATDGARPFDDPGFAFEPWWPGTRVLVFVDGGRVRLQAEHLTDPLDAYPELATIGGLLDADGVVLDGTLLVLDDDGRPDPELLRRQLERPGERIGVPGYVAQDLLYLGGRSFERHPYRVRRSHLEAALAATDWCLVGRAYPEEGLTVADALEALGLEQMSARRLASPYRPGPAGDAWLRIPLEEPVRPTRPPTLALIQRLPL